MTPDNPAPFDDIRRAFLDSERPLICSHIRLDGDAIGSALGLLHVLRALGKDPHVVNDSPIPQALAFLPAAGEVGTAPDALRDEYDLLITVDTPTLERHGAMADRFPGGVPSVRIDHHRSDALFADINWVDLNASSVGEMIYTLCEASAWPVPPEAATCLYAALLTDTGRFTLPNTTPRAFEVASGLLRHGADHLHVAEQIYRHQPAGIARLMGMTLETLQLYDEGRVATAKVTHAMFRETGTDPIDTQDFADVPRSIRGVSIGILLREMEGGKVKASLRARAGIDARVMAAKHGGGGHPGAAGCTLEGTIEAVERRLVADAAELLCAGGAE